MNEPASSLLKAFVASSLDLHCTADHEGKFSWLSAGFERVLGYSDAELLSKPFIEFVHPADRADTAAVIPRMLAGEPIHLFRNRYRKRDGDYLWMQWNAIALEDGTLYATARNVTHEQALALELETQIRWHQLAEQVAAIGHWSVDLTTGTPILHWSDELYRIFGLDPERVTPTPDQALACFHEADRADLLTAYEDVLATREGFEIERRIVRPDGELRWVECVGSPVLNDKGELLALSGILRDCTGRRRMRENMLMTERSASVATLASGIAHEINNPLTYVLANLDVLVQELKALPVPDPAVREELSIIIGDAREGGERIARIVEGLKSLARSDTAGTEVIDLCETLQNALKLLNNEIRHRALLELQFEIEPLVRCRADELLQTFTHLIINAVHAMPTGQADQNKLSVRVVARDNEAVVSISDTGCGIEESALRRIVDPFFSTKPIGEGTGLGLAVSNSIVQAAGGTLEIDSERGFGTTVRVILPIAVGESLERSAQKGPATPAPMPLERNLRILVIDDEPRLCRAIQRMLEPDHSVDTVSSGFQALHLLGEGKTYDVVLCDLMMPIISGPEFYETLESRHPEMCSQVVFMSGGAFTHDVREFAKSLGERLLAKPLSRKCLDPALARVVANSGSD